MKESILKKKITNKYIKEFLKNKFKNSNDIILTFVSINYLKIFNIFYQYFNKLNLNNLLVISLDKKTFLK